jgi:uncharacterized protein YihD (DUF1040 family)
LLHVFFIITCSFSVLVENCILLPKGMNEFVVFLCIVHVWFWFFTLLPIFLLCWNSWLQNDSDIRLLIKFLAVYNCITFHFFASALGGKGVFYSYRKISMLHFCNWKKNALWNRIFVLRKIYRNTGNFFCFNSSLSNLYNNVIIYTIKKSRENSFVCERIYRIFLFM